MLITGNLPSMDLVNKPKELFEDSSFEKTDDNEADVVVRPLQPSRILHLKSIDNWIRPHYVPTGIFTARQIFTIHDTIHGYMKYSELEKLAIDTLHMQRLRGVKQLACVEYVFPMAEHSRFVHSLGTSYLAKEIVSNIKSMQPELGITPRHVEIIGLAGLLHDLGHGPYSHSFEHIINKIRTKKGISAGKWSHEGMSLVLVDNLLDNTVLCNSITTEEKIFIKYCISPELMLLENKNIAEMMHASTNPIWLFRHIISSKNGIDVDRIDYICRDCYHTNIKVSFDHLNMIRSARIINGVLCWSEHCQDDISKFIDMRFNLYKRIYESKMTKTIDLMMQDIFYTIQCEQEEIKQDVTLYDMADMTCPHLFLRLKDSYVDQYRYAFPKVALLMQRIEERHLYTLIEFIKFDHESDYMACLNNIKLQFTEQDDFIVTSYILRCQSKKKCDALGCCNNQIDSSLCHANINLFTIQKATQEVLICPSQVLSTRAKYCEYMIWLHNRRQLNQCDIVDMQRIFHAICKNVQH